MQKQTSMASARVSDVTQSCPTLRPHGLYVAYHAPPSRGFSRQEYWSGLPFPSPEDLPDPGIEPGSSALSADALPSEPPGKSPPNTYRSLAMHALQVASQVSGSVCSVISLWMWNKGALKL